MTEGVVLFITAPDETTASNIARNLVEAGLAGCVNIVGNLRSIYRWQEKIEDEGEVLMVAKSRRELFDRIVRRVKEMHPYTVPEIIALPVVAGSPDYMDWLSAVTEKGRQEA